MLATGSLAADRDRYHARVMPQGTGGDARRSLAAGLGRYHAGGDRVHQRTFLVSATARQAGILASR